MSLPTMHVISHDQFAAVSVFGEAKKTYHIVLHASSATDDGVYYPPAEFHLRGNAVEELRDLLNSLSLN